MDDIVYYQAEINKSTGSRLWLLGLDANELPNFVRASAVVMAKDEYTYEYIGDTGRNGSFFRGWLPHRGKAQLACNLMLPHEDNIINKFRIWKESLFG